MYYSTYTIIRSSQISPLNSLPLKLFRTLNLQFPPDSDLPPHPASSGSRGVPGRTPFPSPPLNCGHAAARSGRSRGGLRGVSEDVRLVCTPVRVRTSVCVGISILRSSNLSNLGLFFSPRSSFPRRKLVPVRLLTLSASCGVCACPRQCEFVG